MQEQWRYRADCLLEWPRGVHCYSHCFNARAVAVQSRLPVGVAQTGVVLQSLVGARVLAVQGQMRRMHADDTAKHEQKNGLHLRSQLLHNSCKAHCANEVWAF